MANKERLEEIIQREVALIVQTDLKDPKIGFVTITDVELSKDKSVATIYVTFLGSENRNVAGLKALQQAKGYIRTALSKFLTIRRAPELIFEIDEAIENGQKIEKIIASIKDSHNDQD